MSYFQFGRGLALICLSVLLFESGIAGEPMNIHTGMMECTFKIVGDGSVGTGFILGKQDKKNQERFLYTLITADHVFAEAKGDEITLNLRRLQGTKWERIELPIKIRDKGKILWRKHPDVDLAAMHVFLPEGVVPHGLVPMSMILRDDKIKEFELGPGTELLCLGFPLGAEANDEGFPILRSGKIASYPWLPSKQRKTFLFDFNVFKGNSGGPVYLYRENPVYGGGTHIGAIFGIAGVVTSELSYSQKFQEPYEQRAVETRLGLAGVIPATFIVELMESLPYPNQ